MTKIRVAIVGVGNCASSLVQGVEYYADVKADDVVPGLMHPVLGGYRIKDIKFVAAFDVIKGKVGIDLAQAIYAKPNNTEKFYDLKPLNVKVRRGPTLDGLGRYYREVVDEDKTRPVDVVKVLRETKADVLICYLPVGSEDAAKFYAECALDAKVAFINCVPVFIAREKKWSDLFALAGVPLLGDDIKSQVGATILHRTLAKLFDDRGVRLDRTYQLNFGGNMDFANMKERDRLESKKISKTNAVTSILDQPLPPGDIHVGPSDHVPWLEDRKWCHIRMEGTTFGDVPLTLECKLEVVDSPNSAGVVIDAVRCAKIALDRGMGGSIIGPSSYFFKSPMQQVRDEEARRLTEAFIAG